jgi:hypothetical protein
MAKDSRIQGFKDSAPLRIGLAQCPVRAAGARGGRPQHAHPMRLTLTSIRPCLAFSPLAPREAR